MLNKYLINEYPLQILPSLATAIGLNEAIVLQQIHYWIMQPKMGKKHDGHKWIYNSIPNWQKDNFPFWSEGTIKRTIASLKKQKLILSKNLNKKKYDRTLWYTIDYEQLNKICDPVIGSICTDGTDQDDPMDEIKMTSPIPEITSENTTENTKDIAPNGAAPPPPLENSAIQKPSQNGIKNLAALDIAVSDMLEAWANLFPDKSQPRLTTYRSKIKTRWKSPDFREHWFVAMERAAKSATCQAESWFQFEFFVRNDENWRKCYRRWMEWKDKKTRQNGRTNYEEMDIEAENERMNAHLPALPPLED